MKQKVEMIHKSKLFEGIMEQFSIYGSKEICPFDQRKKEKEKKG
mgnify:CR=1 FL=1